MNEPLNISGQTPGQILKAAREAKHISISEVVQRLLLSKQIINSLEVDDYSKISAQVYAEGYLKAYAQFLQIPVDAIIKSFRRLNIYARAESKLEVKSEEETKSNLTDFLKNHNIRLILIGIIGVLVLGTLIFFVSRLFLNKGPAPEVVEKVPSISTPVVTPAGVPENVTPVTEKIEQLEPASEPVVETISDTLKTNIPTKKIQPKK